MCFWKCFVNCKHLTVFNKNSSKPIRATFVWFSFASFVGKVFCKPKNVFENFICEFAFAVVYSIFPFFFQHRKCRTSSWFLNIHCQKINETTMWSQLKMCMHNIWIDIFNTNTRIHILVGWQRTAATQLSIIFTSKA